MLRPGVSKISKHVSQKSAYAKEIIIFLKLMLKKSQNQGKFSVKFIYSEKATKFCEISTLILTGTKYIGQK